MVQINSYSSTHSFRNIGFLQNQNLYQTQEPARLADFVGCNILEVENLLLQRGYELVDRTKFWAYMGNPKTGKIVQFKIETVVEDGSIGYGTEIIGIAEKVVTKSIYEKFKKNPRKSF